MSLIFNLILALFLLAPGWGIFAGVYAGATAISAGRSGAWIDPRSSGCGDRIAALPRSVRLGIRGHGALLRGPRMFSARLRSQPL